MMNRVYNPGVIGRGSFLLCLWWFAQVAFAQEVTVEQARAWFEAGELSRAKDAFEEILTTRPEDSVVLYHLGQLADDDETAVQYYLKLLNQAPNHDYADDALFAIGQLKFQNSQYAEAVQAFNRLVVSPDTTLNIKARYWLGRSLLANNQSVLARITFLQITNLYPESIFVAQSQLAVADAFRSEGAYIKAARVYLEFESTYQESDSLHVALFRAGSSLESAGKGEEAQYVFRRLIEHFPESREAVRVQRRLNADP